MQSDAPRLRFIVAAICGRLTATAGSAAQGDVWENRIMPDWASLQLAWGPRMLSILRIMVGLLFLEHGLSKIVDFPHQQTHKVYALFTLNPGLQGLLELIGGALIAVGLFTRPVAFILAGDMAFAYFMAHAPRNFFPLLNGGDGAILYCFVFLYFFVVGAGAWSLDQLRTGGTAASLPAGSRL